LQACADAAIAGDTIELATNGVIAEFVTTDKTLTFQSAAGFTPTVQGLFAAATTVDVAMTVQNLALGRIRTVLGPGGGNLMLTARNNVITADGNTAIEVTAGTGAPGPYGTATVIVQDNRISESTTFGSCASAISIGGIPASFNATVTGNRLTLSELDQCAGIEAVVGGVSNSTAMIDRNEVRGTNFDVGIEVRNQGTNVDELGGTLTATVTNNLVVGQNGNTGAPAGLVVSADGYHARLVANLVNNTISDGRTGVLVSARTDLDAIITGGLFNNVVTFNSQTGVGIETGLPGFQNGYNLVDGNGNNSATFGTGTRFSDPRFINRGGGDYRLAADSPAIDNGLDAALAPIFSKDLAGGARRAGVIDIGAYEFAPALAVPTLLPAAMALLAAFLAFAGMGLLRRRA
jgi:hypothetical protein